MTRIADMQDDLLRRARALPDQIEPRRDLWPDIEAGLGSNRRRPFGLAPLALAALLLISVSSLTTLWLSGGFRTADSPALAVDEHRAGRFGPRHVMGPEFAQTRQQLMSSAEQKLAALSPAAREDLAANLLKIEHALQEISQALDNDPTSDLLLHLLLSTYTDEMRVLRDIDDYSRVVTKRTEL